MKSFICFAIFLAVASAACPERPAVVSDFNLEGFIGTWYEKQRYASYITEEGLDCVTNEYYLLDSGVIQFLNFGRNLDTQDIYLAEGHGVEAHPGQNLGSFNVSFAAGEEGPFTDNNYHIVATDFENYSVAYSCIDYEDGSHQELGWVLSKSYVFDSAAQDAVDDAIDAFLDRSQLIDVIQDQAACIGDFTPFE